MFQAAKIHMDKARRYLLTAKALKGFNKDAMRDYIGLAEEQLMLVELYIK
jgi:hypothetical protein